MLVLVLETLLTSLLYTDEKTGRTFFGKVWLTLAIGWVVIKKYFLQSKYGDNKVGLNLYFEMNALYACEGIPFSRNSFRTFLGFKTCW